ncbi:hypothetical protein HYPSUDRAFT_246273 [Hypholoma sublateritium FD-334 SS-4]|uniref:Uncharacterized protein n=1 Tax=Hypholoma sublateritium (strain FD-334 SS-4) TaxID=945553 RepID=A0A0D2N0J6_HYPSF|nr:hypothetical protein HYPSUDRAFT_246273 [Hypholoma sublateritium FD-334 SS-4]
MALSCLQTLLEDYKVWRTLIIQRLWSTSSIQWSDIFLNGCICWLCECFYIRRCWKAIAMGIAFRSGVLEDTNETLTAGRFLLPSWSPFPVGYLDLWC